MRRLPFLVATVLLPIAPPLLLGTAVSTGTVLLAQAPAQAQSAEAVAKIAEAITVRIEGATEGTGVLVKRDGNRYTVLTAWHVVSAQKPGEELDVYTPDGKRHPVERGSIKRLGEVDMAVLSFSSPNAYEIAPVGDVKSVGSGSSIYVSGFPLPTSAVPSRIWRFLKGDVIANATVAIPNGYQLLYSNQTLPGMSGGAVLNAQGKVVGIHGQGETDSKMSEQKGVAVKTGTNQAVPIAYYSQYSIGAAVVASSDQATTADDYLAQAKEIDGRKGKEQEVIRLSNLVLTTRKSAEAYFFRANAKYSLGDRQGAIADLGKAIAINRRYEEAFYNRAYIRNQLGDAQGALSDYNQSISIIPTQDALNNRADIRYNNSDFAGALDDCSKALQLDSGDSRKNGSIYFNCGKAKLALGDEVGGIEDLTRAVKLNPKLSEVWGVIAGFKMQKGDMAGALQASEKLLAGSPDNPMGLFVRGLSSIALGDKKGCLDLRNPRVSDLAIYKKSYSAISNVLSRLCQ